MTLTTTANPTLTRLLDDELDFSPSFQGIYSNHLAMALVALDQLGAPPATLQATFDAHARNTPERRDDRDELAARLAEIDRDGIRATLRRRLPSLAANPGTALFHPMIRLGYGLEAGHAGQVAAGLLDWERRLWNLGPDIEQAGTHRLREVADDLADHAAGAWEETFDLAEVATRPAVRAAVADVRTDEGTLDDVSTFALRAHLAAEAFITLHMVTGARALRTVCEHLDDAGAAALAAGAVPVMVFAYAAVGAPRLQTDDELDALRDAVLPSRAEIAERAAHSTDPHVIKLANTALVEEARTGEALYRLAASRIVG